MKHLNHTTIKNIFFQNGGWCAASSTALETYNKYGAASNCADGKGGGWANDVYKIKGKS